LDGEKIKPGISSIWQYLWGLKWNLKMKLENENKMKL
jgi:hypothetical protein